MRSTNLAFILLTVISLMNGACSGRNGADTYSGWITGKGEKITFQYPPDWQMTKHVLPKAAADGAVPYQIYEMNARGTSFLAYRSGCLEGFKNLFERAVEEKHITD